MLAQALCIRFLIDFSSKSALESRGKLQRPSITKVILYLSGRWHYLQKSYNQIQAIITNG